MIYALMMQSILDTAITNAESVMAAFAIALRVVALYCEHTRRLTPYGV